MNVSVMSYHTPPLLFFSRLFSNDNPHTEIYTLSLHDALPISDQRPGRGARLRSEDRRRAARRGAARPEGHRGLRSEEHTSELQSPYDLVCRLLLEKKNIKNSTALRSKLFPNCMPAILSDIFPR